MMNMPWANSMCRASKDHTSDLFVGSDRLSGREKLYFKFYDKIM